MDQHPPVAAPAFATLDGATDESHATISAMLRRVRQLFRMDVVFVARIADGRRTFEHVEAPDGSRVRVGGSDPQEESYCYHIVEGRLPQVIPDTGALQETSGLAVTHLLEIGSYVGVPILLPDGSVYGTLCCLGHKPRPDLTRDSADVLRGVALAVAARLRPGPPPR